MTRFFGICSWRADYGLPAGGNDLMRFLACGLGWQLENCTVAILFGSSRFRRTAHHFPPPIKLSGFPLGRGGQWTRYRHSKIPRIASKRCTLRAAFLCSAVSLIRGLVAGLRPLGLNPGLGERVRGAPMAALVARGRPTQVNPFDAAVFCLAKSDGVRSAHGVASLSCM